MVSNESLGEIVFLPFLTTFGNFGRITERVQVTREHNSLGSAFTEQSQLFIVNQKPTSYSLIDSSDSLVVAQRAYVQKVLGSRQLHYNQRGKRKAEEQRRWTRQRRNCVK